MNKKIFILLSTLLCFSLPAKDKIPQRIVVLSPGLLQTLDDVGLSKNIVCAAEPYDKSKYNIKSVGYYHRPNTELIVSCKPDLIITTYAGTPPDVYRKLNNMGYKMMLEKPDNIESIKNFIKKLSKEFNIPKPDILNKFEKICLKKPTKKTAIVVVGLDPIFCAGSKTFVSSALQCAGIENKVSGEYLRLGIENIISKKPDMIIVASDNPEDFKDYKELKKHFKNVVPINPTMLLEPSSKILQGIKVLKELD